MNNQKPKIFISHSWNDNEISKKMAENLKRDGADVWIDSSRISGGDSLPDAIGEGIEWCDVFLLVWSKSARDSYYVKLERNCAVDNRKRIIPCVIDNEKVPTILTAFLRIDFQNFDQGYGHLIHDLKLNLTAQEHNATPPRKPVTKAKMIQPRATLLRERPQALSVADVRTMVKNYAFFDNNKNKNGKGFDHHYEAKIIKGDKVIIDHASGLMWQHSGSSVKMTFENAERYCADHLNVKYFADYNDWRLPTLEEAMSLVKPDATNGLHIDPIFDSEQQWIWTTDQVKGKSWTWAVFFEYGVCEHDSPDEIECCYTRAVRSAPSSKKIAKTSKTPSAKQIPAKKISKPKVTVFRSVPAAKGWNTQTDMLKEYKFFDSIYNKRGKGFDNQFEAKTIKGYQVVIDKASELMWQQSGSDKAMKYENAQAWISALNRKGFAGFSDWRLPTLEEAMSLVEPRQKNDDLHIDPIFDNKQRYIWTCDIAYKQLFVRFSHGTHGGGGLGGYGYIRAVRSAKSRTSD